MNFEEFRSIVGEITHVPLEKIKENSSFRDDLGIDSLQMLNFLIHLARRLNVKLEVLIRSDDLTTVGGVFRTLRRGGGL